MKPIKRVYIAGAYNSDNIISCLDNMRRGQQLAYQVLKAGFAPFCPFLDYQYGLIGPTTREEFQRASMAFLDTCDAILVVPEGHENSLGTQEELKKANILDIPVFFDINELICYFFNNGE